MTDLEDRQERRKHRRAAGTFDLHLRGAESTKRVRVRDISVSGVSCRTDFAIPEMALVQIDLFLPDAPDTRGEMPVHCEGAVVRCQPATDGPPPVYDLAVFFTEVPPDGRNRIAAYVEKKLAEAR